MDDKSDFLLQVIYWQHCPCSLPKQQSIKQLAKNTKLKGVLKRPLSVSVRC